MDWRTRLNVGCLTFMILFVLTFTVISIIGLTFG